MITVNAMGDTCPIPVVKTKAAIKAMTQPGEVEILVDNEISAQNLEKMAVQKKYPVTVEKQDADHFRVVMTIGEGADQNTDDVPLPAACAVPAGKNTVVVLASNTMGSGNDELGASLMKAFVYALAQQDELPATILCYNGGVKLTCAGSPSLEDFKSMQEQGVEILSCGTCLNFYGLTDSLQAGGVTNMYTIVEKMSAATLIIRP